MPTGSSLGSDYTLVDGRGEAGSLVDAAPPLCVRACALIIVDGFDNTRAESIENFDRITASYRAAHGPCDLFGFTWRSDVGLTSFADAETRADVEASATLRTWLDRENRACGRPIHLVGHSLAARVVLAALQPHEPSLVVDSVALVAPAIPDDALLPGGELASALAHIGRVGVFFNNEDYAVLGFLYPRFARRRGLPLGLRGSRDTERLPRHVFQFDFSDRWGPTHSAVRSYGAAFWAHQLGTLAKPRDGGVHRHHARRVDTLQGRRSVAP